MSGATSMHFLWGCTGLRALYRQTSFQKISTIRRALCVKTENGESQPVTVTAEKNRPVPSHENPSTDYQYFSSFISNNNPHSSLTTASVKQSLPESSPESSDIELYKDIDLSNLKPVLQKASYNLATFVNESEVLSNLVKLGVDLSKVEKDRSAANLLLKLDFTKDVQPYLSFLHTIGIADDELGYVLSKNPGVFSEDIDTIKTRVNYLSSKKFNKDAITRIIAKAPKVLSLSTKELDVHLGFLQKEFLLTGNDVRFVVTRWPQVCLCKRQTIKEVKFTLDTFLGFSQTELKQLLLTLPKLYDTNDKGISSRFNFIHNKMGLSHERIVEWPGILRTRLHIIRPRHLFLQHLGRDQYDPSRENYVSMKTLVSGTDASFCSNVAHVSIKQYNDFLKSL